MSEVWSDLQDALSPYDRTPSDVEPLYTKGLCRLHWERQHRTGTIVGQQDNDSLWEAMVYGLDPLDRYSGELREQWVGMFNSFEDAACNIDAMADYNDWESV